MEYAILTVDRETYSRHLLKAGKTSSFGNFTSSVCILKTDATLLEMKEIVATINKCDTESCTARVYEKNLRYRRNIWSFLNEGKRQTSP